ncbi:MAG: zinc-ribbon and DUF3426 domain-containing protein [Rhodanobacteraceae bacterium]
MYTQCPECLTIFSLDTVALSGAHGNVRCSHCSALFDALRSLATELPAEPIDRLATHPALEVPPQLELPVFRPNIEQGAVFHDPDDRKRAQVRRSSLPTFARRRRRTTHARTWPWLAGSALLLLMLGAQVAWAERTQLLDNAMLRPWLDQLCAVTGCHLPLRHDLAALALVSRDIRAHPSVPGALIISATLRNDADFTQAFPIVEITLSDLDDNRVAMRRFRPREYVGDNRLIARGLASGASAALVFEVADPGHNAVAFQFAFE